MISYHGACGGCTQQSKEKIPGEICVNCRYFDCNWTLPDLNNRPPTESEIARERIKKY